VLRTKETHWTLVGFDMSQRRVIWFAKKSPDNRLKNRFGRGGLVAGDLMLTCRDAIAGLTCGISMLVAPRARAQDA
jgi:hypothetical protein